MSNIQWASMPIQILTPFYGSPFGVPGAGIDSGLRNDTSGRVLWVDPNHSGTGDQKDGTIPSSPLQTIEKALTLVRPYRNDVIAVMNNGSFTNADPDSGNNTTISENVTMDVPGVRLVGVDMAGRGVTWNNPNPATFAVTVTAMDCTVEGFLFTNGDAVYAEWDGVTLWGDNLTLRHCIFDDTVDVALQLEFAWYCHIHDNFFQEVDEFGIYVDTAGSGIAYADIHDNKFMDAAFAIWLLGGSSNNDIHHNSIYNGSAEAGAAATNEGINTTGGAQNMIYENKLSCLLPVPANGDLDDFNSAAATDAWMANMCLNGFSVTNPT